MSTYREAKGGAFSAFEEKNHGTVILRLFSFFVTFPLWLSAKIWGLNGKSVKIVYRQNLYKKSQFALNYFLQKTHPH
jgi:hypothetical protein